MKPVQFAVIGGDGATAAWLAAIRACAEAEPAAVCDRSGATAALAAQYRIEGHDDPRALLARSAIDAVVVALSPAGAERVLGAAAERGAAAILDTPPARRFEEAAGQVARFEAAGRPLLVASGWRFDAGLAILRHAEAEIGAVVQAEARVHAPWPEPLGWRGDGRAAGGGVLINEAYDALDALVHAMGLPADVLAQLARLGPPSGQPYDNEDTATVLLRYADGRAAVMTARWGAARYEAEIRLSGARSAARMTLPDCMGRAGEAVQAALWPDDGESARGGAVRRIAAVRAMVRAMRGGGEEAAKEIGSSLREHLAVMAVLETCYLSSRTGVPESPRLIFERGGGDSAGLG